MKNDLKFKNYDLHKKNNLFLYLLTQITAALNFLKKNILIFLFLFLLFLVTFLCLYFKFSSFKNSSIILNKEKKIIFNYTENHLNLIKNPNISYACQNILFKSIDFQQINNKNVLVYSYFKIWNFNSFTNFNLIQTKYSFLFNSNFNLINNDKIIYWSII